MEVPNKIVSGIFSLSMSGGVKDEAAQKRSNLISILADRLAHGTFGGFQGLLERFNNNGMQNQLASWISTRPNEAVSLVQIEQILDSQDINEIAKQAGFDRTETSQELAQLIPQFVDKLTPTGVMPEQDVIEEVLTKIMKFEANTDLL